VQRKGEILKPAGEHVFPKAGCSVVLPVPLLFPFLGRTSSIVGRDELERHEFSTVVCGNRKVHWNTLGPSHSSGICPLDGVVVWEASSSVVRCVVCSHASSVETCCAVYIDGGKSTSTK